MIWDKWFWFCLRGSGYGLKKREKKDKKIQCKGLKKRFEKNRKYISKRLNIVLKYKEWKIIGKISKEKRKIAKNKEYRIVKKPSRPS